MSASTYIRGFGAAFPGAAVEQAAMWQGFFARHADGDRVAERLFRGCGVRTRHAVVDPTVDDVSSWSTGDRMRRYVAEAPALGKEAVGAALAEAGLPADEAALLTVVSCTGYATPGLDIRVAADLGMAPDVRRLLVGHMGCYAALPGLGAVADHVLARGRPGVMLCLELTSLHLQPPPYERDQIVAHALFGDAAAAVVVMPEPVPGALEVIDTAALTDPATADLMTWDITDTGFRMGLSPRVPAVLARHVRSMITGLLARHGLTIADVDAWAVHPGGPRILDVVAEQLVLPADALDVSRAVLAQYGNCSSATVLMVLDALRAQGRPRPGRAAVAMAFGPGLTLYATLLRGT